MDSSLAGPRNPAQRTIGTISGGADLQAAASSTPVAFSIVTLSRSAPLWRLSSNFRITDALCITLSSRRPLSVYCNR